MTTANTGQAANDAPFSLETLRTDLDRVLEVGANVFVNFQRGQAQPARTRLWGWAPGRFLLLDELSQTDAAVEFRSGAPWLLKYVAAGYVCVAKTRFLANANPALAGVFVSFPQEIHVHSLRRHHRVTLEQELRYLPDATTPPPLESMIPSQLFDLSVGGCGFWTEKALRMDSRVAVAIAVEPGGTPELFFGTVRHCTMGMDSFRVGVAFDPHDEEHLHVIGHLLGDATTQRDVLTDDP